MNKKIIWALIILIVLGGGYYFFNMKPSNANKDAYSSTQGTSTQTQSDSSNTPVATSTEVSTTPTPKPNPTLSDPKTYTLAEVSAHSSSSSCWSAIEGKVYDLTSWIGKHPGGAQAILAICGKDGSQLFDGQHGMDPRAKGVLPNFYLGDLTN